MKLRRLFSLGTVVRTQVLEEHNPPLPTQCSSSFLPDQQPDQFTSSFVHCICRNARQDRRATLWAAR